MSVCSLCPCVCVPSQDGYFLVLSKRVGAWMGYWVLAAGCVGMLSQFNSSMTTYARLTQVCVPVRIRVCACLCADVCVYK